jgi:hypothetical protein
MINSRRLSWVKDITRMSEMRNAYINLNGKPDEKRHLAVYGRIILK